MKVPNNMNNMRLSPVLLAVFTALAALGLSKPASGQMLDYSESDAETAEHAATVASSPTALEAVALDLPHVTDNAPTQPPVHLSATNHTVPTVSEPEPSPIEFQAQAPTPSPVSPTTEPTFESEPQTPPVPGAPPPGTPTPSEETPDRFEFELTPGPADPELRIDTPGTQPIPPTTPPTPESEAAPPLPEARVLVSEVVVSGVEGELQDRVYEAVRTQPGRTTTRAQLQEDINAIFATGFFANVRAVPEDTPLGVRVTFEVQANPILRGVQLEGNQVLPQQVVDETFKDQYGSILNLRRLQEGIKQLNKWYQDQGYVLAQVIDAPRIAEDGTVILEVAEGVIGDIQVRFLNKEGEETNEEGEPISGRTRPFIITRELQLRPGDVFNRGTAERDLQRVFGLGIFEDVRLSLSPGDDPRQVNVVVNAIERNTGSVAAGAGISSASGLFGTVSYQEQNLGGNNQKLGAELQVGQRELLFNVNFTDPWIAGDPFRTSYTVNAFRQRSISLIFDGGEREVFLEGDGGRPRILRLGSGVTFNRPLSRNPFERAEWVASLGFQYQRVSIRDVDGDIVPRDQLGNDLSFSGTGRDDLFTVQLAAVRDRRNSLLQPTSGSLLRLGVEQSVPVGQGSIFLNRLRGSYSFYLPTRWTRFTEGCRRATPTRPATRTDCPQALAFNIQGGTVLGDLPPYEAFALGGSSSVRGYDEGDVGSGRSYIQATAEYRFPLFAILGGALFIDAATDLGTGDNVPGNPAGVRGKPGSGIGYGLGVRIQSPLGPIRIDYGFNDRGGNRLHFGIGERF